MKIAHYAAYKSHFPYSELYEILGDLLMRNANAKIEANAQSWS